MNTTDVISNQTTIPQSESIIIKPFTIPRDEPSNSNGLPYTSSSADSNNNSLTKPVNDLVLLSQRYNDERFGDEIIGEILNNGTITAEYAKVSVSFYDENGAILGSDFTYTDPSTIAPDQKTAFNIFITSDTIEDDTETYEFTLQWQNNDFNDFSKRITGEQVQAIDNDDNDNDDDNNDNDNDDNNNKDRDGNALKRLNNLFRK
ncbi:MAG TPA: FxLYD domain-containing protein [Candidatus Nitrosocosmicus sp.]|nr:FxLYD domain-containing protein [Candidatus Nitrosocosmicus sp.]